MTQQIDLSTLPPPAVVEELSFESILADMEADLVARFPEVAPILQLESSVAKKHLEVCAYRELLIRARINDAARALLLARAVGTDLDNLAANFGVSRLVVTPASGNDPAVMESDDRLRRRVLLAIEAYSVAGPAGAYVYHALTAAPALRDATATTPAPGHVIVTIMSSFEAPTPSSEQLATVALALSADAVRPLTDIVSVVPPDVIEVDIVAALTLYPGPDGSVVAQQAAARLNAWLRENAYLGRDLRRSAIFSRLHVDGVQSVDLISPASDIVIDERQAIRINSVSTTIAGVDT